MSSAWLDFWTAALAIAGTGFAVITLVVAVRGGAELLRMLRGGDHRVRKSGK